MLYREQPQFRPMFPAVRSLHVLERRLASDEAMGDPSTPRFRIRVGDGDELPINSVEALARRVARGDLGPETLLFDQSTGTWQAAAEASVVRFILDEMSREGVELPAEWLVSMPTDGGMDSPADPVDTPAVTQGEPVAVEEAGSAAPLESSDPGPRPARRRKRISRRRVWLGGLAAGIVIVFLGLSWWRGSIGIDEGPDGDPVASGETGDEVALPQELVAVADVVAGLTVESYRSAVDSMRSEYDLAQDPPQGWLGGNYLANAHGFPQVSEFWARYSDFLDAVRAADGALFDRALSQGLGSSEVPEDELAKIRAHLEDQHARSTSERAEQHAELSAAATAALALHDFLRDRTEEIRYVPALGNSPPAGDLVLEVATSDAETRRELDRHLDTLFQALDRSRGGRPPSPFGLGEELFAGFSPF